MARDSFEFKIRLPKYKIFIDGLSLGLMPLGLLGTSLRVGEQVTGLRVLASRFVNTLQHGSVPPHVIRILRHQDSGTLVEMVGHPPRKKITMTASSDLTHILTHVTLRIA